MYEEFLTTFGEAFRAAIDDFRKNGGSLSGDDESFRQGYLMGLHRVFTLMEQTAEIYDVSIEKISLEGLSEQDFLT